MSHERMHGTKAFDPDDARLTAYVLGELEGEDRSEVEALLARSAEARDLVEGLRETAEELRHELALEDAPGLTPEQLATIESGLESSPSAPPTTVDSRPRPRLRGPLVLATAAGVLAALGFAGWMASQRQLEDPSSQAPFAYGIFGRTYRGPGDSVPASPRPDLRLQGMAVRDSLQAQPSLAKGLSAVPSTGYGGRPWSGGGGGHGADASFVGGAALQGGQGLSGNSAAAQAPGALYAVRQGSSPGVRVIDLNGFGQGTGHLTFDFTYGDWDQGYHGLDQELGLRIVGPDGTEAYDSIVENPFVRTTNEALSTFSIDIDTASYANVRRFLLRDHQLPPPSAVRIEELVNYFRYDDPEPTDGRPFAVRTEVASAPWAPTHRLVRIGLRAKDIPAAERPASNLVFLVDVSGSMQSPDKLPLLVRSMKMLVEQLDARDHVAIVVYAGASGLVLSPTSCADAWIIMDALDRLQAGGSTNGGAGIQLAYATAREHFVEGGLNRVILCTDGDFNVGVTDQGSLVELIEKERKSGVFLSVLGFGTGNLKDSTMEKLADKGNGNYAYIDSLAEARKVLVAEMGGTLVAVAKDVKIQVEFNPTQVQAWRLIGYENRLLAAEDFADDTKDAGEIGAGLAVTALYEIVPFGVPLPETTSKAEVDPLRYQEPADVGGRAFSGELMFLKLRYKPVESDKSLLIETPVRDPGGNWYGASDDFKLASGVALFGMLLRHSPNAGQGVLPLALELVLESQGDDPRGYRGELLKMIQAAGEVEPGLLEGLRGLGYIGRDDHEGR